MSDFVSLGGGGIRITDVRITTQEGEGEGEGEGERGGATGSSQQFVVADQPIYPLTNPPDEFPAAAVAVPWFYHPVLNQEEQQFFPYQHIPQHQDMYASSTSAGLRGRGGGGGGGGGGIGLGIGGSGRVGVGISGRSSCQDCGNQAKKDCMHLRCRTCCMTRSFDCPTHVKSTWVSAAKRRERQQQQLMDFKRRKQTTGDESVGEKARFGKHKQRAREEVLASAATDAAVACARLASGNPSPGLEVGSFPAELSTSAVFNCVRVSSADDPDDQFAYQTSVKISGHVFKGILYDHGSETTYFDVDAVAAMGRGGGDTTSSGGVIQPLDLITASSSAAAAGTSRNAAAFLDPSLFVAAATSAPGAYMSGTQLLPHQRLDIFEKCNTTQLP